MHESWRFLFDRFKILSRFNSDAISVLYNPLKEAYCNNCSVNIDLLSSSFVYAH